MSAIFCPSGRITLVKCKLLKTSNLFKLFRRSDIHSQLCSCKELYIRGELFPLGTQLRCSD